MEDHPTAYHFMIRLLERDHDKLRSRLPSLPARPALADVRAAAKTAGLSLQKLMQLRWEDAKARTRQQRLAGTLPEEKAELLQKRKADGLKSRAAAEKHRQGQTLNRKEKKLAESYEKAAKRLKARDAAVRAVANKFRTESEATLAEEEEVLAARARLREVSHNRGQDDARRARADVLGGWHCIQSDCDERFDTREGY